MDDTKVRFAQVNKLSTYEKLDSKMANILYFVLESKQIYKGEELFSDGDAITEYNSYLEFPVLGRFGRLYIDKSSGQVYRWDSTDLKYAMLSDPGINDIEYIYGGSADG